MPGGSGNDQRPYVTVIDTVVPSGAASDVIHHVFSRNAKFNFTVFN